MDRGFVVPPGQGKVWNMAPGRSAALKVLNGQTAESVMMFEEVAPAETETPLHIHQDSDEIAYSCSRVFLVAEHIIRRREDGSRLGSRIGRKHHGHL